MTSLQKSLYDFEPETGDIRLHGATSIPNASGYLWNKNMLLNLTCQGYASCHFMQPEPATYSTGPALEAKTFLQPEHAYYQGHPGRFFYIKDHHSGELFSLPFAPMNKQLEEFQFLISNDKISWQIQHRAWLFNLSVSLTCEDIVELWQLEVVNQADSERQLSIYPCFNIGYQSWMNQGAEYSLNSTSIVGCKISPYQKLEDYYRQKDYRELTFFSASENPDSYCANLADFLGSGGWTAPTSLQHKSLRNENAIYQTPVAVMQFNKTLAAGAASSFKFLFGAAQNHRQIEGMRAQYLNNPEPAHQQQYKQYLERHSSCLKVETPDIEFNHIVNHWLPRQAYYHGDVNRLTTDPQTRNYLQDAMGMCYLEPDYFRQALMKALAQQNQSGAMPDGILLHKDASLKYINQVPHADPCVWLPICLQAYLDETHDFELLDEMLPFADCTESVPVYEHINRAMRWLLSHQDERHLSLIQQGDWCDPMNMVGHLGKGVSSWLSMATSWAFQIWARLLKEFQHHEASESWYKQALTINESINKWFWADTRYGRGITDAGRLFGTAKDAQGKIYLNPQSWSILCNCVDEQHLPTILDAITQELQTPYGVAMLAPAYTGMVEDIGRLTQKFPGVAENGSLYNHAIAFFVFALYQAGETERAFETLQTIFSRAEQVLKKQQLPNFVPNYYRGAHATYPEHCGLSSRLFNTGTIAWLMRSITEQLFGLKGCSEGLQVQPQLPSCWPHAKVTRRFRGCNILVTFERRDDIRQQCLQLNGEMLEGNVVPTNKLLNDSQLLVLLPMEA